MEQQFSLRRNQTSKGRGVFAQVGGIWGGEQTARAYGKWPVLSASIRTVKGRLVILLFKSSLIHRVML